MKKSGMILLLITGAILLQGCAVLTPQQHCAKVESKEGIPDDTYLCRTLLPWK